MATKNTLFTKPLKQIEPRRTTRLLPVTLTKDDRLKYGQEMADSNETKDRLEQQASEVNKDFKAKIAAQVSRMGSLSSVLRAGYEFKEIPCLVFLDAPKPGSKQIVRTDTDDVIETMEMTESEKQSVMEFMEQSAN